MTEEIRHQTDLQLSEELKLHNDLQLSEEIRHQNYNCQRKYNIRLTTVRGDYISELLTTVRGDKTSDLQLSEEI